MSLRIVFGVALVTLCACQVPPKPAAPEPAPSIKSFTVAAARINKGESASFAFETERATTVSMVDQNGQDVAVTFDAATQKGTATTSPTVTSFYVLHADSANGRDSAFVQVAVSEPLQQLFLVVVPQVAKPGQAVDLVWSAAGGSMVALKAGARSLSTDVTGTVTDRPTQTTTYTLTAKGPTGAALMATAQVRVEPVIDTFTATPPVARPGQKIVLNWTTRGAETVSLKEDSFGELFAGPADPDGGVFEFTVPFAFGDAGVPVDAGVSDGGMIIPSTDGGARFDGGSPLPPSPFVRDGLPLRFVLTAATVMPQQSVAQSVRGRVGIGPVITSFTGPSDVSTGKPASVTWTTANAARIELFVNGRSVLRPNVGASLSGSYSIPALGTNVTFMLVATDSTGLSASATIATRLVMPPTITSFTLPATVASPSATANAAWQTTNASTVTIHFKNGPTIYSTTEAARLNMGTAPLHFATTSTVVLDAFNAAGEKATAERTITVSTPATISLTPSPAMAGTRALLEWDFSSLSPTDVAGLPPLAATQLMTSSMPTNFFDISDTPAAKVITFSAVDDGTATIPFPIGFSIPMLGTPLTSMVVSTNGFVAFGATGSLPTNTDLSLGTSTAPPMVAPFWDDLTLGAEGKVQWFLDGVAFPRRLVVQWTKVSTKASADSRLTFQVQLWETGKLSFNYGALTGTGADATGATIGVSAGPNSYQRAYHFNMTGGPVVMGDELSWFSGDTSQTPGSLPLVLSAAGSYGFFLETANGFIPFYANARVFSPGSIVVNEGMPVPASGVAQGRWFELFNATTADVSLDGLQLSSNSAPMATFDLSGTIDAGAYVVVGESSDMNANGGAPVGPTWSSTELTTTDNDSVVLRIGAPLLDGGLQAPISTLTWNNSADGGVIAGTSVQPPTPTLPPTANCARMTMFGSGGQVGTPGAPNESCFDYTLRSATANFEDISGEPELTLASGDDDEGLYNVTFATPFPYFGQMKSAATISTNGWVLFGAASSATFSNQTTPSATALNGVLGVFWDDMELGTVHMARRGNKTIIQWNRFAIFANTSTLTFQVKFFDDGAIEYHYAEMTSATAASRAAGDSATVWISKPGTPAVALPVSVNQARIVPNSAWRFTPRN